MSDGTPRRRRPGAIALAVAACCAAAGCGDGPGLAGADPGPTGPAAGVAVVRCRVEVGAARMACTDRGSSATSVAAPRALDAGAFGERLADIVGGQGVNVILASTGVCYGAGCPDGTTPDTIFKADVTVENLRLERMGTADGVDTAGIKVFFHSGPVVTAGEGEVTVVGEDGTGMFTGDDQPYVRYDTVLARGQVSDARTWRWNVPATVETFAFTVYLETPLLPILVFDRVDAGNRDIWRVALDGSDLVRVTTDPGDDRSPTTAGGMVVFTSFRDGNGELYSMPLAGGVASRLTNTEDHENEPALSPDGARLAFMSDASGVNKLWTAAADGGGAARATAGLGHGGSIEAGPSWAPDGESVVFVSTHAGGADLYVLDEATGAIDTLLVAGTPEVEPAWSPDGEHVAFASQRGGQVDLYLLDVGTGTVMRLTDRAETDAHPTWLRDGRLAYIARVGGIPTLRWLDPASPGIVHDIGVGGGEVARPAGVR